MSPRWSRFFKKSSVKSGDTSDGSALASCSLETAAHALQNGTLLQAVMPGSAAQKEASEFFNHLIWQGQDQRLAMWDSNHEPISMADTLMDMYTQAVDANALLDLEPSRQAALLRAIPTVMSTLYPDNEMTYQSEPIELSHEFEDEYKLWRKERSSAGSSKGKGKGKSQPPPDATSEPPTFDQSAEFLVRPWTNEAVSKVEALLKSSRESKNEYHRAWIRSIIWTVAQGKTVNLYGIEAVEATEEDRVTAMSAASDRV